MRFIYALVIPLMVVLSWPQLACSQSKPSYKNKIKAIEGRRTALRTKWRANPSAKVENAIEAEIISSVENLSKYWIGTTWALGAPQTKIPQVGKINCGTFVGRVLADAGFNVQVKKLQRQPSQLIIKSFVGGKRVRKFSNAKMSRFLKSVREMGPGLYIIGLDFHVGLLLQTKNDLRFIHASFETNTVVNEDAATAMPITTSAYKVVGKILSRDNIDAWIEGRKIVVKGKW